ncbi:MAG: helix-turn-helix transcriptional regulator [Candidatus Limnocylindrales bacterium]
MGLKDLRARWAADVGFQAAYKAEYPYEAAAAAIAELRATLGLSQAQLADLIGSTQSVISRAESGQHSFQISLFQRIAEATGARWESTLNLGPATEVVLSYVDYYPIDLSAADYVYTAELQATNVLEAIAVTQLGTRPITTRATRSVETPVERELAAVA